MKLLSLLLPLLLVGCASTTKLTTRSITVPEEQPKVASVAQAAPAPVPASAQLSTESSVYPRFAERAPITESGLEMVEVTGSRNPLSESPKPTQVLKKAAKVFTAVKDALKDEPVKTEAPSAPKSAPMSAGPAPTGAKIQFFGMDLELWLGEDNSWSTILKMIVFLLVVYGGFRWINFIFDKKNPKGVAA